MNADAMKRCPHYQIYSEPLNREGKLSHLIIRRCIMTERMLRLLEDSEEGKQLGEHLVIRPREGRRYAFIGPDMEPVTQETCEQGRCEGRCTSAYAQTLQYFGKTDPQEAEVECETPEEAEHPSGGKPAVLPT